jgi:hypothetical protein
MGEKCFDKFRLQFDFALKNPTASAGFEPANLGTKGQHATSRPPKPYLKILVKLLQYYCLNVSDILLELADS